MPIGSDQYSNQRNVLAQAMMGQGLGGLLNRAIPKASAPAPGRTDFEGGTTGGGMDAARMMQPLPQNVLQQNAGTGNMMNPQQTQRVNAQPGMMPGTVPSATPQLDPGLSMPPPQPPQQMMPQSLPSQSSLMTGGMPGTGGASVGSKGAGANPPPPVASMNAGM